MGILNISKEKMIKEHGGYYYGLFYYEKNIIYMVESLPSIVYKSVLAHELSHLERGKQDGFFANEAPSWWAGFKAQPVGFFLAILMSIVSIDRISLYIKILKK